MYQALYRKYRPKTFDEVVGQEPITTTLKNEIGTGRPAHAYLFMGSRGTGKTTCSRLVAKAVNCLAPEGGNPCNACESCIGIDNGSLVDVVEIDAASNNGVENIRELREEAVFLPNMAKFRVYIIDEVHMLSAGAFNALLKIMEEPPPHVLFVLATTEVHKVPATILSRCQRFDFRPIPSDIIAKRLMQVAGQEQISLEEDAAVLIGRLADGGMRDALSLLDLCASHSSDVTVRTVSAATGLAGQETLFDLCDAVLAQDSSAALEIVGLMGQQTVEYDRLCQQLIAHYRNLMVAKGSKNPGDLIVCLPETLERYIAQAKRSRMSQIVRGLGVLSEALSAMTKTPHRKTELEMAAIRLCDPSLDATNEALIERLERLEAGLISGAVAVQPAAPKPAAPKKTQPAAPQPAAQSPAPAQTAAQPDVAPPSPSEAPSTGSADGDATPFDGWKQVLAFLAKRNGPLCGFLTGSTAYLQGGRVLIDSKNTMFLELVRNSEKAREDLKQCIAQVTGKPLGIGPYVANEAAPQAGSANPLESILQEAQKAGIPIEIQ